MADDLRDSRTAVDWAESQLETLDRRIKAWQDSRPYEIVTEFDPERRKNAIRYEIRQPLPLLINAEAGAIINSIRTSLDILAVTLAKRNGITELKELKKIYFPISECPVKFTNEGLKRIKKLSDQDRTTICGLTPYKGGNDVLYALHELDIIRKHRNLLEIYTDRNFQLSGKAPLGAVWPHELPGGKPLEHKFLICWVDTSASDCKTGISVEVRLAGTEVLGLRNVVPAITEFARLAHSIIAQFD